MSSHEFDSTYVCIFNFSVCLESALRPSLDWKVLSWSPVVGRRGKDGNLGAVLLGAQRISEDMRSSLLLDFPDCQNDAIVRNKTV